MLRPDAGSMQTSGESAMTGLLLSVEGGLNTNKMYYRYPMRTQRLWLPIVFAFAVTSASGCHNSASVSPTGPPTSTGAQQTVVQMKTYQINHSNLPPDQKQRLLSKLGAAGTK